jgi:hypothetical protein
MTSNKQRLRSKFTKPDPEWRTQISSNLLVGSWFMRLMPHKLISVGTRLASRVVYRDMSLSGSIHQHYNIFKLWAGDRVCGHEKTRVAVCRLCLTLSHANMLAWSMRTGYPAFKIYMRPVTWIHVATQSRTSTSIVILQGGYLAAASFQVMVFCQ